MFVVSPGSDAIRYMEVIIAKIEVQSKTLRQTVRLMRVNWRRGSFLDSLIVIVAASDLGSWLAPPLLPSDLAIKGSPYNHCAASSSDDGGERRVANE
jgi:hypothetical protein